VFASPAKLERSYGPASRPTRIAPSSGRASPSPCSKSNLRQRLGNCACALYESSPAAEAPWSQEQHVWQPNLDGWSDAQLPIGMTTLTTQVEPLILRLGPRTFSFWCCSSSFPDDEVRMSACSLEPRTDLQFLRREHRKRPRVAHRRRFSCPIRCR
jgi:hypothetical protein